MTFIQDLTYLLLNRSLKQWIAIQNGSLPSAQLINGSIVHAKTPNLNSSSSNNNSRHSTNKKNNRHNMSSHVNQLSGGGSGGKQPHRRRNSHSHSGGGGGNATTPHHATGNYHHNHHHHHHNNNSQQHNANQYQQESPRGLSSTSKVLSRSNENLSGKVTHHQHHNQTPGNATKKLAAQQSQSNNVFLKHFGNNFSKDMNANLDAISPADSRAQSIRAQTQYYQRIQQNELSDILSLKENRSKASVQPQQLGGQNSKFKPVITSNNSANKVISACHHQYLG